MKRLLEVLFWFVVLAGCTNPNAADPNSPCTGSNGNSMTCSQGSCSHSGGGGCSAPVNGVYCCNGSGSGGGSGGTVMGCWPPTGCGTWWYNNCDNYCYPTSSGGAACSTHRQCY